MRIERSGVYCAALTLIGLAFTGAAYAGQVSTTFFSIEATSSLGTESWSIGSDQVNFDPATDTWSWNGGGIGLGEVATLGQANLTVVGDPQIAMGFAMTAGAADVTVTITSAILSFNTINNPDAAATAGVTLTQSGGAIDAYLNGLAGDTGSAYAAYVNAPGGMLFDEYVTALSTTTTTSGSGNSGGFVGINGGVSSMQVVYSFELSAGDQASGTSNFLLVPEPSSLLLAAVAVVFAGRRR